jgi:hypothetical protein
LVTFVSASPPSAQPGFDQASLITSLPVKDNRRTW